MGDGIDGLLHGHGGEKLASAETILRIRGVRCI
jgi:hypothetical protein